MGAKRPKSLVNEISDTIKRELRLKGEYEHTYVRSCVYKHIQFTVSRLYHNNYSFISVI